MISKKESEHAVELANEDAPLSSKREENAQLGHMLNAMYLRAQTTTEESLEVAARSYLRVSWPRVRQCLRNNVVHQRNTRRLNKNEKRATAHHSMREYQALLVAEPLTIEQIQHRQRKGIAVAWEALLSKKSRERRLYAGYTQALSDAVLVSPLSKQRTGTGHAAEALEELVMQKKRDKPVASSPTTTTVSTDAATAAALDRIVEAEAFTTSIMSLRCAQKASDGLSPSNDIRMMTSVPDPDQVVQPKTRPESLESTQAVLSPVSPVTSPFDRVTEAETFSRIAQEGVEKAAERQRTVAAEIAKQGLLQIQAEKEAKF